jgi:hypothetical protein
MTKQYRPYFTLPELQEIITCLKSHPTPSRLSLVRKLGFFIAKIEHEAVSPQYIPTPRPTLAQRLELEESSPETHEVIGEAAYQKHLSSPIKCTPKEIAASMEYMYTHGLMDQSQELAYESSLLSIPSEK